MLQNVEATSTFCKIFCATNNLPASLYPTSPSPRSHFPSSAVADPRFPDLKSQRSLSHLPTSMTSYRRIPDPTFPISRPHVPDLTCLPPQSHLPMSPISYPRFPDLTSALLSQSHLPAFPILLPHLCGFIFSRPRSHFPASPIQRPRIPDSHIPILTLLPCHQTRVPSSSTHFKPQPSMFSGAHGLLAFSGPLSLGPINCAYKVASRPGQ